MALEGRLPGLLAAAVCPASARLTSHLVSTNRKGGRPARPEPVPAPSKSGSSASRRQAASKTQRPKSGTTRSVTTLGRPLNHGGQCYSWPYWRRLTLVRLVLVVPKDLRCAEGSASPRAGERPARRLDEWRWQDLRRFATSGIDLVIQFR